MVVALIKPTTFDDAMDKTFTAEEVHKEEAIENENAKKISSGTTGSWVKRGGQFKNKNKKQKFAAYEACGKAHKTELCWRTTGACLVCGSLEHRMVP